MDPASCTGVGLRTQHIMNFTSGAPKISWVEIHSETFFVPGGPRLKQLDSIRENYNVSCHCVGLSLGSLSGADSNHLKLLKNLVKRIEPNFISDHVSFCTIGEKYFNDLLPIPYNEESLELICLNIAKVQDYIGRQILIENPTNYISYRDSSIPEDEFINHIVKKTDCGILLDINNLYVNSINNGFSPGKYLKSLPKSEIKEIHLAGHYCSEANGEKLLIDTHDREISRDVWLLYKDAIGLYGPIPTLVEWDMAVPQVDVLIEEAYHAQKIINRFNQSVN